MVWFAFMAYQPLKVNITTNSNLKPKHLSGNLKGSK